MADGFIVRKGGAVTEQALAPTITEVSTTTDEIVFTITNNDASTAVILWEVDDSSPDANSLELATGVTSSNITVDSLADDTTFIVYATANVTGKIKSEVASESITTDALPVYTAATGGATEEYDSGGKRYKSHTFTSDDDFIVTTVGDADGDRNKVDYLIIAGGGSGGINGGGGGGAGGFRTTITPVPSDQSPNAKVVVTAQTYSIVVGAGGASVTSTVSVAARGNSGSNSSGLGITATGGGTGGSSSTNNFDGANGGSGGGCPAGGVIGNGTLGQGRNGGVGNTDAATYGVGGGGGGAGAVGADATSGGGGAGGNGLANTLRDGTSETRAGGGGGGGDTRGSRPSGAGGTGGGGAGANGNATAGTVNTGSGGGGVGFIDPSSTTVTTGAGGKGIVVIRYEIAPSV
jgi:hypothetical protein